MPRMAHVRLTALFIALALTSATAVQRPSREPRPLTDGRAVQGVDQDRLRRSDRVFQQHVDDNRIAGAVVLVLRDGVPLYERAFGWSDKEAGRRRRI